MANNQKPTVAGVHHLGHRDLRANIPPAELEPVLRPKDRAPLRTAWERRNRDLDPQLVWRGKDPEQTELTVDAPPIYVQEQVHPKALIEDLRAGREKPADLFGHFGLTNEDHEAEVEFYRHSRRWSNRMILGDSLQVMASLAEREGLRGQVQAIYIDPPYGIRFNSNFQWSTSDRDVKDGDLRHLTREPEQVKAFRDTWRDGIHSYLGYLRDRLVVARELLTESGSCFVQIGDENVHRVRAVIDEVFGEVNFVSQITFKTTTGAGSFSGGTNVLASVATYLLWFAKDARAMKYRVPLGTKNVGSEGASAYRRVEEDNGLRRPAWPQEIASGGTSGRFFAVDNITSQTTRVGQTTVFPVEVDGSIVKPTKGGWKTNRKGMDVLRKASRLNLANNLGYIRYLNDFSAFNISNVWTDTVGQNQFGGDKIYIVQSGLKVVERCLLMTTDPGDLVLDPTCGSGTTAYVAEQWGRRWITLDTSRVALALARARIMGAKYPWYLLADSPEGQRREAEASGRGVATAPTQNDVRHGFVYERVPHVTLKSIANNGEIDVIWERMQPAVEAARDAPNAALGQHAEPFPVATGGRAGLSIDFTAMGTVTLPSGEPAPAGGFMEWEVPRTPGTPWPVKQAGLHAEARLWSDTATPKVRRKAEEALAALNAARGAAWSFATLPERPLTRWPEPAVTALAAFWLARIARQKAIDASIAAKAEFESLYDRPYQDPKRIRVAGPFTVESLSPHRSAAVDENGELIEEHAAPPDREGDAFRTSILENLRKSGVHQSGRADRLTFDSLEPWPGTYVTARGAYREGEATRHAAVFIGPEYGTVARADLVDCAREAADAGMDVVVACAFNFEARAQEFKQMGRIPILQARMNPDLHMAGDLKPGGGNLFVVFGEPDIEILRDGDACWIEIKGVDIFKPATGRVESTEASDIACWFIDTDYSGESFFVRHAYFPRADLPYKALRATLKGEIDEEAWESLKRTTSRPFPLPASGRIAVKVINHLGDEVMKVFTV